MTSGRTETEEILRGQPEDAVPAAEIRQSIPSVIGSTLVMKGELTLDEDLIIEGTFDGTIVHRGSDKVVVRRVARVKGEISGHDLQVEDGTNLEDTVLSGRIRLANG